MARSSRGRQAHGSPASGRVERPAAVSSDRGRARRICASRSAWSALGGALARVTRRNRQRRRSDRAVGRARGRRRVLAPARGGGRLGARVVDAGRQAHRGWRRVGCDRSAGLGTREGRRDTRLASRSLHGTRVAAAQRVSRERRALARRRLRYPHGLGNVARRLFPRARAHVLAHRRRALSRHVRPPCRVLAGGQPRREGTQLELADGVGDSRGELGARGPRVRARRRRGARVLGGDARESLHDRAVSRALSRRAAGQTRECAGADRHRRRPRLPRRIVSGQSRGAALAATRRAHSRPGGAAPGPPRRHVAECFGSGGDIVKRNLPQALSSDYERRVARMHDFIGAYLPASGEAPMLGDTDDSRLHAVSAEGWLSPRLHALGLPRQPSAVATSTAWAQAGFYILRAARDHLITRCGPVGSGGTGRHDHNDQLSFELVLGGRRVVSDSGTYAYTRDLEQRFAFRGTAAHSVVQVDAAEQNPIVREQPWGVLADRTRSRSLRWEIAPDRLLFEGQHHGFAHRPSELICRRRFIGQVGDARRSWHITDELIGQGAESLTWRLHLAPTELIHLSRGETRHELELPGEPIVRLILSHPAGFTLDVGESRASDRYGVCYSRPCILLRGAAELPARFDAIFIVQD